MREEVGDLWFRQPADARVITVNNECYTSGPRAGAAIMGTGTAEDARDFFLGIDVTLGNMIAEYGPRCFRMPSQYTDPNGARIVTMPVKNEWRKQASLELIAESARQLLEMADKFHWQNVVMPRPGCGSGKLMWQDVKPVLDEILDDRFVVMEQAPRGATPASE
jgi:hypothetical protein